MSRGDVSSDVVGTQPTIARRHPAATTRDHRIHTRLVLFLVINKETVLPGGLVIPSGF